MMNSNRLHAFRSAVFFAVAFAIVAATAPAFAAGNPDFDAVTWMPLDCETPDLVSHTSPAAVDFAGNATFPAAYSAHDANYLYFRYRMDGNPSGPGGFNQNSWTALMQIPSGDPFQYQYQLSLNGKDDTIEVWKNTVAMDIDFTPLFHDDSEVKLFSQSYAFTSGSTVNTTPLARSLPVTDGSSFGGNTDYFLDFAIPVSVLISNGAISTAADLDLCTFFPATATNPNNYNKGHLNCPFLPVTEVSVNKSVEPESIPVDTTTPVVYTIAVQNEGTRTAKGLVIEDPALPDFFSNVVVTVSADDASVTWMVMSTNPLSVKVPALPPGATITVQISADATPSCASADFTNVATAWGTNAMETSGQAVLDVLTMNGTEICDGKDNDCDGLVDEGGDALCDDGNACTGTETCGGAAGCQAGTPVVCTASDQCHVAGTCDSATGLCSNPAAPTGTSCSDGNACTQSDSCVAGVCVGAVPVICGASDQCHGPGICDPSTGQCSNPALPNGTPCNDGDACTGATGMGDTCQAGVCDGGTPTVCTASDQCHVAGTCNPSTGVCSNPNAADGTPCNDGNACTGTTGDADSCQAGVCDGGSPTICTASDQCHEAGTCNPASGMCSNPKAPDGTPCNDGNACTGATGEADSCHAGMCNGGDPTVCTASDQCHEAGTCNSSTGACSNPNAPDGTPCNDGNACTGATGNGDACQTGVCNGGNPTVCTASDQCHVAGTCDPSSGACSNPNAPDGTPCNDGDACTGATGSGDSCQTGVCNGGDPTVCTASDQCHEAGTCNPATGDCSNPIAPNGTPCDDGNACTGATGEGDTCRGGTCNGGDPTVCTASDQCHTDGTCDPQTGACSTPNAPNGTPCTDGNLCTGADGEGDTCQGGLCTSGNPVVCTASDQCHTVGTCDPQTGVCSNPAAPNGTPCNDGNACTGATGTHDSCQTGVCQGGDPTICSASDQCHVAGTCNPSSGGCSNPNAADGTTCTDDGDNCTTDSCTAGVCAHTPIAQCLPPPEICDDGTDNDGDGLIDCADSDCVNAPNCLPREICGNCLDDDGDGMVDYEDSDCCSGEVLWMKVKKLRLKPGSGKARGNRIRMNVRYSPKPELFDPVTKDTSIQLRDGNGELFCTTVAAKNWKHPRKRLFRFRDKAGSFAGGLARGRFKMRKSGMVRFATRGKKMSLRSSDGQNVLITVRVGEQCAKEMKTLRTTKKRGLRFP